MTPDEITAEIARRDVHVRQYLGVRFEIWADGVKHATCYRPIDAEAALREVLGITVAEGVAAQRALERHGAA